MTVHSMRSVVPGNQITFTTSVTVHIIFHNKVDTLLQLHFPSKLQRSEFQGESTAKYTDPFFVLHILYYSLLVGLQNVSKDSVEVGSKWVKCTFGVKTFHPEMCNVLILSPPYFTTTIQPPRVHMFHSHPFISTCLLWSVSTSREQFSCALVNLSLLNLSRLN